MLKNICNRYFLVGLTHVIMFRYLNVHTERRENIKTGLSPFDFAQYILTIDNVVEYLDMTSIRSLIYHVMSFYLTGNIAMHSVGLH